MRSSASVIALGLSALLAASAEATPFSATLSFQQSGVASIDFVGAGSGTSSPGSVSLPGGLFAGTGGMASGPAFAVVLASQDAGAFTGTPLQGTMPLHGTLKGLTGFGGDIPLVGTAGGVGIGGTAMGSYGDTVFTAMFRPFSAGMQTLTTQLQYHIPYGAMASMVFTATYTAAFTGTDSRTPGGLGQITLVSPILVRFDDGGACLACPLFPPAAAVLTVSFVPEPGTAALLGAGTLGLAAYGRRRLLRREA